ncbi:MAG: phosphodiester glycosidase family protein [Bacillota bacterium]|nr:phosphodiester glycosidase family protein [Bacillota bacterium]
MKINLKKTLCVLAISALILKATNVRAQVIEDRKERTNIGSGVEYVSIDRLTDKGFIDIDVIKLDANNPYSKLIPLFSKEGLSDRQVLTEMIDSSQALAGINGDFFEVTKYPMALGSLVNDGLPILSTPEEAFSRNSFYINKEGQAGVGPLKNNIVVTIGGDSLEVNALNKLSKPYKSLALLDENWGKLSPGKNIGAENVELLIANGKIIDKRLAGNPFEISPGTFVLSQVGQALNKFNVGDSVSIDYGSYKDLSFAIGGGNILVNDGQIPEKLSTGRAPRTAIAMDKDNKIIYLVTVDGRNNSSIGMGEEEFAEFLKSIGAYKALNLDGGGSTTMAIKYSGDSQISIKNTPSDGKQRKIVSGVGIKSTAPIEEASYLTISAEKDMFAGFSYPVQVKVFDKNHNRLPVDQEEITLSSDYGTFSAANINVTKKGFGTITASYKDLTSSTKIHFHSPIKEFRLDVDSLQVDNNKVHIFQTIYGLDDMGYKKKIPADMVSFDLSPELGTMEANKFTARAEGKASGIITASYKDLKRIIPVTVSKDKITIQDFENIDNTSYWQSQEDKSIISGNISLDQEGVEERPALVLNYNFANYQDLQSSGLEFKEKLDLNKASAIGLWIKGDKQGAKVQAVFTDENGLKKSLDLVSSVSFSDWKYVEANLPEDLKGNIFLEKIQLTLKENKVISSTIKFSGLKALIQEELPWKLANQSTKFIDSKVYAITDGNPNLISIASTDNDEIRNHLQNKDLGFIYNQNEKDPLKATNKNFSLEKSEEIEIKTFKNTAILNLISNKNGLRSANPMQYKALMGLLNKENIKNVIITMNIEPENIPGKKERAYFLEKIDQGVKAGKNVFIIVAGPTTKTSLENGYRKINFNPADPASLDIYITENNLSYILKRF